uniref:B box-type domain-containing protein n=1 Tax=Lotus japonicus TaxID=34305 RepID=I3SAY6_LOTJA|nr:unknown [Lotus japonicus]
MKIQCDACEKAPATVICCADEAALCAQCDVEIHAANKLASKHQRLLLESLSNKLPKCDICQEKTAFIFCVEDRALFCQDCDEPIHAPGSISANHQRFLATGIKVAGSSKCTKDDEKSHLEPPSRNASKISAKIPPQQVPNFTEKIPPQQVPNFTEKVPPQQVPNFTSSWAVDDLLDMELSSFDSPDKYAQKDSLQFGELEWLADDGLFGDQFSQEALAAAEVPQLPATYTSSDVASYRTSKSPMSNKKARIEVLHYDEDDDEYFTVPNLG